MKSLSSVVSLGLMGCAALALSMCSKSDSHETTASETEVAASDPAPKAAGDDLEGAIAAPGAKTVTAMGASGKTQVLPVGGTTLAETDTYVVNGDVPASAATGADGIVTIHLSPKPGWHINQDFPTKLKITAPEGITLASDTQSAKDAQKFNDDAAVFQVKFKAASAGAKKFKADFRFAVCTDSTCDPKKAELAWNLDVK
jgi:hypothetical protein